VVEVIDPGTQAVLPPGEEGELVVTTLRKQAQPLLRYRTHDLSRLIPEPCACGSPYPRIARITGRTDDMFKVRGVQVSPAQIDTVLAGFERLSGEYQVMLTREDGRERFLVRVESDGEVDVRERVAEALRHGLGVRPDVEAVAVGGLPRTDRKTRRVIDER
jgi:phenylacetate-CoA ligase